MEKEKPEAERTGHRVQELIEKNGFIEVFVMAANSASAEFFRFVEIHKLFDLEHQRKRQQANSDPLTTKARPLANLTDDVLKIQIQGEFVSDKKLDNGHQEKFRVTRHENGNMFVQCSDNPESYMFDIIHATPSQIKFSQTDGLPVHYVSNGIWRVLDLEQSTTHRLVWKVFKDFRKKEEFESWTKPSKDYLPSTKYDMQFKAARWYVLLSKEVDADDAEKGLLKLFADNENRWRQSGSARCRRNVFQACIQWGMPRLLKYLLGIEDLWIFRGKNGYIEAEYENGQRVNPPGRKDFVTLSRYPDNRSPLHHAVAYEHPEIIEILLQSGADPNELDEHQVRPGGAPLTTPFHLACRMGNLEVIELMLKYKADPYNEKQSHGESFPLLEAVEGKHSAVVDYLIMKLDVDPKQQDSKALHRAIALKDKESAELIREEIEQMNDSSSDC